MRGTGYILIPRLVGSDRACAGSAERKTNQKKFYPRIYPSYKTGIDDDSNPDHRRGTSDPPVGLESCRVSRRSETGRESDGCFFSVHNNKNSRIRDDSTEKFYGWVCDGEYDSDVYRRFTDGNCRWCEDNYGCSSYRAGYFLYPWKS